MKTAKLLEVDLNDLVRFEELEKKQLELKNKKYPLVGMC